MVSVLKTTLKLNSDLNDAAAASLLNLNKSQNYSKKISDNFH